MSYINESCGCSDDHHTMINTSPLLSGSQELAFSPQSSNFSILDSFSDSQNPTNNFTQNDDNKQNYSLDDLINMSKKNTDTDDQNKFSDNNIHKMNNYNSEVENALNSINGLGNGMNSSMNGMNSSMNGMNSSMNGMNNGIKSMPMMNTGITQMNSPTMTMPNNVNTELQAVMNKIAIANNNELKKKNEEKSREEAVEETSTRFILKNFNIVLIVIIAFAWHDVAKFYINRSIKFGDGTHRYYVYYAVIATVILYGTSKYIHFLN